MRVIFEETKNTISFSEVQKKLENGKKGLLVQIHNNRVDILDRYRACEDDFCFSGFGTIGDYKYNTKSNTLSELLNRIKTDRKTGYINSDDVEYYWFDTLQDFAKCVLSKGWKFNEV